MIPTAFQDFNLPAAAAKGEDEEEKPMPLDSFLLLYKCQQMDRNFDMDQIYFTTTLRNHLAPSVPQILLFETAYPDLSLALWRKYLTETTNSFIT